MLLSEARQELARSQADVEHLLSRRAEREFAAILGGVRERQQEERRERRFAETFFRRRAARDWELARRRVRAEQRQRERAQRRYRWREVEPQRVSFDFVSENGFVMHERVGGRVEDDPFVILTGTTADHINDLLGDISLEDVGRMDEWQLENLRQRIIDAGLAPKNVQRSERERLKIVTPHRGEAPAPKVGKKSGRHQGGKERSRKHRARGKRFDRHKDRQPRDGWGGVILPDEEAA